MPLPPLQEQEFGITLSWWALDLRTAQEARVDTQVEFSSRVVSARRERASSRLLAHVERRSSLEGRTISRMYDLYATYYDATSPSLFEKDLGDKDWVFVLRDESGMLAGFSSLAVVDASVDGRCLRAIYSGDTIIG